MNPAWEDRESFRSWNCVCPEGLAGWRMVLFAGFRAFVGLFALLGCYTSFIAGNLPLNKTSFSMHLLTSWPHILSTTLQNTRREAKRLKPSVSCTSPLNFSIWDYAGPIGPYNSGNPAHTQPHKLYTYSFPWSFTKCQPCARRYYPNCGVCRNRKKRPGLFPEAPFYSTLGRHMTERQNKNLRININ